MSLLSRLVHAVRSWRRQDGGRRASARAGVSVERLDHRQLLSVNFTGNVATDFPASMTPGVVVFPDNPNVRHPPIAPALQPVVKVSGFDINGIRVSYTAADDTLSVGLEQPASQQPTQPGPVISGDSDNNGNDGTVNPAVTAIEGPSFRDFQTFGGSEFMGAFLDLKGNSVADVVAGYSNSDPRSPKEYQVAQAVVNGINPGSTTPDFGTMLPQYTGNVYKVNSPLHPNLEFDVTHFSQLYLAETGRALTADSTIGIGAFGGSGDDLGIGEAYFPEQTFTLGRATVPPPTPCPPVSPPVIINVHENRHINTAHPDLIRVNVLGSSGFDVTKIDPATVRLGGAAPQFSFTRFINKDEWLDETFVFKGTDIHLPRGYTEATVSGSLTNGTTFSSSVRVFNRNDSFYTPAQLQAAARRQAVVGPHVRAASVPAIAPFDPPRGTRVLGAKAEAPVRAHAVRAAAVAPAATLAKTVSVPRASAERPGGARVGLKLRSSLNQFLNQAAPTRTGSASATGGR